MPRLSQLGDALTGVAGGITAINGAIPPSLAASQGAGWEWLTNGTIIGQSLISGTLGIYSVVVSTDTLSLVIAEGANNIKAGGNVYEKWWTNGVKTNVVAVPSLPKAGPGWVDWDGTWCVATIYATGSGISVYSKTGTLLQSIPVSLAGTMRMRDGLLTYNTVANGWPLVVAASNLPVARYVARPGITNLIPIAVGSQVVIVEYDNNNAVWTVRRADQNSGRIIATGDPFIYGMDAIALNGRIRVAWSTGAGEAPGELVVMDINTSSGTTQKAVVSGTSLVWSEGPQLEGSSFDLAQPGRQWIPYQHPIAEPDSGERPRAVTRPWQLMNEGLAKSVATAQAGVNQIQPIPPSTFDLQALTSESQTGFPLARTVQDSATVTWDFTVPGEATANAVSGSDARATMLTIASLRA